ncbi:MAG: phosphoglycerate kinase [Myxococcota bacterium]
MGLVDGILSIEDFALENQRVLLRLDLDVADPARERARLRAVRASIEHAQRAGARVVLAAHRGTPEGKPNDSLSMEPIGAALSELLGCDIYLPDDCVGDAARKVIQDLRPGQVCLLENLDFYVEERDNDETFARKLASFADIYVNDSLRDSRTARASVDQLARSLHKRCMGLRLKSELTGVARVSEAPEKPFVLVVGGANAAAGLDLIQKLLDRVSLVLVGGTPGNTLAAARGAKLQKSSVDDNQLARARALFNQARDRSVELVVPIDFEVAENARAKSALSASLSSIGEGLMALDVGPNTLNLFSNKVTNAKTVLWFGPLGAAKNPVFAKKTLDFANALAQSSAFTVTVADDTAEAIGHADESVLCKFGLVSTAGRAALELIEGRKLPGIEALRGGAT